MDTLEFLTAHYEEIIAAGRAHHRPEHLAASPKAVEADEHTRPAQR